MTLIINWLILSLAVFIIAELLPGIRLKSTGSALLVSLVFGLLNMIVGTILFVIFSVITLGIAWLLAFFTRWLIDAMMLKLTESLTGHITFDSFGWALLGALLMALLGTLGQWALLQMY